MADGTNPGVTLSVTGTVDGLNAALGELSDQGNSRFVGADTVAISVSNGTETSSEFVPIPITVSPVFTNVGTFWGGIENAPITIGYWEIWNNSNAGTGVLFRLESVTSGALMKGGVLVEPGALIGPDAVVVWTPAANDWGITEAFRITAWDGQNGSSNPAAVTVYLASIPTALPQSVSTTLDTPVQIALAATDPKGSAISFAIVDFPKNGTILGDLPNVEYIPNPGYIGSDSFTFAASDWAGQGDLAAVGIIVHPCDSKPGIAARTNYTLIWPTNSLQLSAYVSDDGIPAPGKLTAAWRKIDGPGSVELSCDSIVIPQSNPPMPSTNLFLSEASFAALGRYLLRLTLDDAWVTNSVDARVTIIPADPLGALIVNAGTDQTLNHPGVSTLTGTQPVGEHLKYLVCAQGRPTACMAWASALRHLGPRDRFIGWSPPQRRANIHLLAYNTRFLILPWVKVPGLASHLLARVARRIAADWQELYAHPVYLLETFIDPQRFRGACYRAANWLYLGLSTGRGKNSKRSAPNRFLKQLWVYPLRSDLRRHLGGADHA